MMLIEQAKRLLGISGRDANPVTPNRGNVIWVHASSAARLTTMGELGGQLKAKSPDLEVVVSATPDLKDAELPDGLDRWVHLPAEDTISEARTFLQQIDPALCVWTGGEFRPNLLRVARDRSVRLLLADIREKELPQRQRKWLRDQTQVMMDYFGGVVTSSTGAINRIRVGGYPAAHIVHTPPVQDLISPAPCDDGDLADLTAALHSRPVWLAAYAQKEEFDVILQAQRTASRRLHRLLLVVAVEEADSRAMLTDMVVKSGLRCADWEAGDLPDENTQVVITCADQSLGLWYRASPITLMAGSMIRGLKGNNPMEAVALGSAVIFGPGVVAHRATYDRLMLKGAAVKALGHDGLSTEIARLSAPDKAAEMALVGWQLVTEGAQLTDQLFYLITATLPQEGEPNATA